jgi:hypothetical protein
MRGSKRKDMYGLIDAATEAYLVWREECDVVRSAYALWRLAPSQLEGAAFEDYFWALECEEDAANVYAGLIAQVRAVGVLGG